MKNIVLSFGVQKRNFSIWANSTYQSTFFLFLLLENIPEYNVHIVNFGIPVSDIKSDITFDINSINFTEWEDICNDIDLFICNDYKIDKSILEFLRGKGTKIIKHITNNHLQEFNANFINDNNSVFDFFQYDRIWINQQFTTNNKTFIETLYNCKVDIVPFLWNSVFIDGYTPTLVEKGFKYSYQNKNGARNITIFESNKTVNKTSLCSILIAEKTYKENPDLIDKVRVLNSSHLTENKFAMDVIGNLSLMKDSKLIIDDRYNTPYVLAKYTDIVLSNRFDTDLCNFYFDVLYGGYPLVHNSKMINNCGFFYGGTNIESGCIALSSALICDKQNNRYVNSIFNGVDVYNDKNVNEYKENIDNIF